MRAEEDEPGERASRSAGGAAPAGGHRRAAKGSFLRELPVILVVALVLSLLIKTFLVQAFYIPSRSMEDTLLVGDRVFVNKLATRFGDIERGDVVVFSDPADWLADPPRTTDGGLAGTLRQGLEFVGLAPSTTGDDLIKRVIGVGGDRITCCDEQGRLSVNGVVLDEPYVFRGDRPSDIDFQVTVPDDALWVMGDHRSLSEDSRAHLGRPGGGFVPLDNVIGRAFVVVWPLDRLDRLTRPDSFDEVSAGRG